MVTEEASMKRVVGIRRERGSQLGRRRSLSVELPEWIVRILELSTTS
jgi:hypothetical protein